MKQLTKLDYDNAMATIKSRIKDVSDNVDSSNRLIEYSKMSYEQWVKHHTPVEQPKPIIPKIDDEFVIKNDKEVNLIACGNNRTFAAKFGYYLDGNVWIHMDDLKPFIAEKPELEYPEYPHNQSYDVYLDYLKEISDIEKNSVEYQTYQMALQNHMADVKKYGKQYIKITIPKNTCFKIKKVFPDNKDYRHVTMNTPDMGKTKVIKYSLGYTKTINANVLEMAIDLTTFNELIN